LTTVDLLADLDARGLIHDSTDRDALAKRLADGPIGVYVGFDPSGDSLHAGNLLGQVMLRRFQLAGHKPIVLAGGATGMIGDPSGVSEERNLLDAETLSRNLEKITVQLEKLLDFSPGPNQARLVNNYTWTSQWSLLDFLRETGKHVTVNQMVARESVRARMESDDGISYTEFTYQLLQAADFCWLYDHEQCEMQMGGSDQWGNIVTGIDLIRRRLGKSAFGLTWPLLLKADGTKFGKSAGGAVWLDPERTSPYQFRQFFVQVDDEDVEQQLLWFTLLPVSEIEEVMVGHRDAPELRRAQRLLATSVTSMVHGDDAARAADEAADVLFGGSDPSRAPLEALEVVSREVPTTEVPASELQAGLDLVSALVRTGLATSNGEARRLLSQGGVAVNGRKVTGEEGLGAADLLHGRYALLRKGRSTYALVAAG
jgi:tyrosyl-tRNA synthetase